MTDGTLLWNLSGFKSQPYHLPSSVTSGKSLNLSELHFQHKDNFLKGRLGGLNEKKNLYKVLSIFFSTQ